MNFINQICIKTSNRGFILILILLFVGLSVFGQSNYTFGNISTNNGLSSNTVYDIIEDEIGFIWVATDNGLNRFDGYNCNSVLLPLESGSSISKPTIFSLEIDREKIMWIGLKDGGLMAFDQTNETFRSFPFDDNSTVDWSTITVKSIFEDSRGWLWIGTFGGGAIVLDKDRKVQSHFCTYCNEEKNEKLSNDFVFDFEEDDQNHVYIATAGKGINVYNSSTKSIQTINADDEFDLNSFSKTLCIDGNQLWVGTEGNGLYRYDIDNLTWINYKTEKRSNSISSDIITDVKLDRYGRVWIASDGGGLNIYDEQENLFETYQYDPTRVNSLSTDAIYDLQFDEAGNLWIGTFNGGINTVKAIPRPFWNQREYDLERRDGLRSVLAIKEDNNNRVWLGTDGGGIFYFDAEKKRIDLKNASDLLSGGSFNDVITCIYPDENRGFWFGSFANGLNYFDFKLGRIRQYLHDDNMSTSLAHNNVWDLELDVDGGLWIGTLGGGVDYLSSQGSDFIHLTDQLSSIQVIDILLNNSNEYLWVATESAGLNRVNISTKEVNIYQYTSDGTDGLSSNNLEMLFEDSNGDIWIVSDSGLDRYDISTGAVSQVEINYNFPIGTIRTITEDDQGYLWLATSTGVHRLDLDDYSILEFGTEVSLMDNSYNPRASLRLKDGRIVFGGVTGFSMIDPSSVEINKNNAVPVFTDFQIGNETVPVGESDGRTVLDKGINENNPKVRLSYKDRGIYFEFSTTEYTDPARNKYAYMLEGFDREWNYTDASNRSVYYSSLSGGSYKLKIKASNSSGLWSDNIRSLDIKVSPPFWKTSWFILIVLSLLFACIFFVYRFLLNRQKEVYQRQVLEQEQEILKQEQQILQLTNKNLEKEVTTKKAEFNASVLQVAHKNEFLTVLKNRIKKIKSDSDEIAAKPLRSIINIINTELRQEDYWDKFQLIFNQTFQDFIDQIASQYPNLTSNDHRLCCFIKMKLNNREIAAILNITLSAVEQAKYRLKKKIGLDKSESLYDYIQQFGQVAD